MTKEEKSLYDKQRYAANRQAVIEEKRIYRKNNNEVISLNSKKYEANRKGTRKSYNKNYQINNANDIKIKRKEYRIDNKEIIAAKRLVKRKTNPLFALRHKIGNIIRKSLHANSYHKTSKSIEILGSTIGDFKTYIESKWLPWMSWDNYGLYNGTEGYGCDIDHIEPISKAKTDEDVIRLNHYTNLQPLCSYVNRVIKSNR